MRPAKRLLFVMLVLEAIPATAARAADAPPATGLPSASPAYVDASASSDQTVTTPFQVSAGGGPSPGNAGSSSGVSNNPSNNTTGSYTIPGVPLPVSSAPPIGLFPELGTTLLNQGIDLHGVAFDHFLANPTAGVAPGQINNLGVLALEADLDLGKLVDLRGGNIHIQYNLYGLKNDIPQIITDTGGYLTGTQTTPSSVSNSLSVFTYEQKLLDDRLSIEAGRTNVYHYFFLPNSLDPFTYFSSAIQVGGDFPTTPWPVWGGHATYHWTPKWYAQLGSFEDNFLRAVRNPNDFGIVGNTGAQVVGEIGYRSEFSNAAYPSNMELGALWDARTSSTNVKGSALQYTGRNEATDYSSGGVLFFQGLQTLWRGASRRLGPPANIGVYGAVDATVDKPQPIDMDSLAGVNFTGFIPGRPFDALEIQVHYQRLSAIEANYETRLHNIFAGPGSSQPRDGFSFEVNGNIQLTPWFSLRPIVEQFTNPDSLFDPAQRRRPSDGFITAVFATISLGHLFGTSPKPF